MAGGDVSPVFRCVYWFLVSGVWCDDIFDYTYKLLSIPLLCVIIAATLFIARHFMCSPAVMDDDGGAAADKKKTQ